MHSVFDFRDGITDHVRCGMLVYPGEEDAGAERISVLSPMGAALIGLAKGRSFQWRSATGVLPTLQVVRVVHQPERAGKEHHARAAHAPTQSELMRTAR